MMSANASDKTEGDACIVSRSPSPNPFNNAVYLVNVCFNDVLPHSQTEVRQTTLTSVPDAVGGDDVSSTANTTPNTTSNSNNANERIHTHPPGFPRLDVSEEVGGASGIGSEEVPASGDAKAETVGARATSMSEKEASVESECAEQSTSSEAGSSGSDSESSTTSTVVPTTDVVSGSGTKTNVKKRGLRNVMVYQRDEGTDDHVLSRNETRSGDARTSLRNSTSVEQLFRRRQQGRPKVAKNGNGRVIDNIEFLFEEKTDSNYRFKSVRGRNTSSLNNFG